MKMAHLFVLIALFAAIIIAGCARQSESAEAAAGYAMGRDWPLRLRKKY